MAKFWPIWQQPTVFAHELQQSFAHYGFHGVSSPGKLLQLRSRIMIWICPHNSLQINYGYWSFSVSTLFKIALVKALAHYKQNCKDFSKKIVAQMAQIVVYKKKLLLKSLQLWTKVVVLCMEDNCIFCSFVCSLQGS